MSVPLRSGSDAEGKGGKIKIIKGMGAEYGRITEQLAREACEGRSWECRRWEFEGRTRQTVARRRSECIFAEPELCIV